MIGIRSAMAACLGGPMLILLAAAPVKAEGLVDGLAHVALSAQIRTNAGTAGGTAASWMTTVERTEAVAAVLQPATVARGPSPSKVGATGLGPSMAQSDHYQAATGPRLTGASHSLNGVASYYSQGEVTATGERFDKRALTAAHKTLPFGTRVKVTRLDTGGSVVVRINDRGPFKPGRVIDLSERAAEEIGITGSGLSPVKLEILGQ